MSWLYTFVGNKAKMTLKTLCFGVQQDGINAYFIIFVETLNTGAVRMGHRTKRFFQWSGKMGERL